MKEIYKISESCSVPFEIILYVYSYCGGSHFGNDYNVVDYINRLNDNSLLQITEHNMDYCFNIEEKNVQFQKVDFIKKGWDLSNRVYKTVDTLSELYILLGREGLKNRILDRL